MFSFSVQTHDRARAFKCLTCGGLYVSPAKLRLHEKSAHTTPTQPSASRKRPLQHGAGGVGMKSAFELVEDSLNGSAQTHRLRFATERPENYVSDLGTAVLKLAHELIERLTRDANVKWFLSSVVDVSQGHSHRRDHGSARLLSYGADGVDVRSTNRTAT